MLGARSEDHERVDPAESLMREVGAQLRQARLERAEDLDDVAQHLRIKSIYLFGIEQGNLTVLPGRTYALGFLRSYADYLGFDGEDLVTRVKSTVAGLTDRTQLRIRTPLPENRLPRTPILLISLAVVAGIYAGWSYLNRSNRVMVDSVAEVPSSLRDLTIQAPPREPVGAAPVAGTAGRGVASDSSAADEGASGADGSDASGATAAAQARGGPVAPQAGPSSEGTSELALNGDPNALAVQPAAGVGSAEPAGAGAPSAGRATAEARPALLDGARVDQATAAPRATLENAAGADPANQILALLDPTEGGPDAPQVYERANADARVILRARERAWIQVSSLAGDYTFTRTLEPGEALLVPNRSDLELWTGNAGGLEIIVDGTRVPALAQGGAVRRHVSLDPDRLLGAAVEAR